MRHVNSAEKTINDRLMQTPDVCLLGLSQIAVSADTDVVSAAIAIILSISRSHILQMRSFSLVLLRRFLFRPCSAQSQPSSTTKQAPRLTVFDILSSDTLSNIELLLLHSFSHEPSPTIRHAAVEAITAVCNYLAQKGELWQALQDQAFNMTQSQNAVLRESAFRLFAGTRILGMGVWQMDIVLKILKDGLEDRESADVCFELFPLFTSQACNLCSMLGSSLSSTRIGELPFVLPLRPTSSVDLPPHPNARHTPFCLNISISQVHFFLESTCDAQARFVPTTSPTFTGLSPSANFA